MRLLAVPVNVNEGSGESGDEPDGKVTQADRTHVATYVRHSSSHQSPPPPPTSRRVQWAGRLLRM